ncbi:MAG: hypothetical protein IT348_09955 [Candidatus Eisenbacteria bacterium]|nr:hypothetical protein [Candidatus Eisenbacteria bacterium]
MEETMGSQRQSIYVPERLRPVLDVEAGAGLSARVAAILDRYGWIMRDCPPMTRAEWLLVLDACNGWASWSEAGETLMVGLAQEVADHAALNSAGNKWGLSEAQVRSLVGRLNTLLPVEKLAVVERVERFWRRSQMGADDAMREAGIVPVGSP